MLIEQNIFRNNFVSLGSYDFKATNLIQKLINIYQVQKEFKFEVIKSSNTEIIIAVGVAAFVVIAIVVVMAVRHVHNSRDTGKGRLFLLLVGFI